MIKTTWAHKTTATSNHANKHFELTNISHTFAHTRSQKAFKYDGLFSRTRILILKTSPLLDSNPDFDLMELNRARDI